jgi:hypothetical protein
VIDASNSTALPQFRDTNRNGDYFDDSFLRDTRLKPRGLPEYQQRIDRYSVVVPPGTQGPIAVSVAVYYQSIEAIVALKFLGNLADTNNNFVLEPCVLGGLCDGRTPATEPPVVEGAPPVPMVVRNWFITVEGMPADRTPLRTSTYPTAGADQVYQSAVVKVFFSKPVRAVDSRTFTLSDSHDSPVAAWVDQIGDGAWGLFPNQVQLHMGESYTARLKSGVCDLAGNCTKQDVVWRFTVSKEAAQGRGNTAIPTGFAMSAPPILARANAGASLSRRHKQQLAGNSLDRTGSNSSAGLR